MRPTLPCSLRPNTTKPKLPPFFSSPHPTSSSPSSPASQRPASESGEPISSSSRSSGQQASNRTPSGSKRPHSQPSGRNQGYLATLFHPDSSSAGPPTSSKPSNSTHKIHQPSLPKSSSASHGPSLGAPNPWQRPTHHVINPTRSTDHPSAFTVIPTRLPSDPHERIPDYLRSAFNLPEAEPSVLDLETYQGRVWAEKTKWEGLDEVFDWRSSLKARKDTEGTVEWSEGKETPDVLIVRKDEQVEGALKRLRGSILSMDVERTRQKETALIQISDGRSIILIQTKSLKDPMPPSLQALLKDRSRFFFGCGIHKDAIYLLKEFGIPTFGCIDLNDISPKRGIKPQSLADFTGHILSVRLDKGLIPREHRGWSSQFLHPLQIDYATNDVQSALCIFHALRSRAMRNEFPSRWRLPGCMGVERGGAGWWDWKTLEVQGEVQTEQVEEWTRGVLPL